MQPLTDTRLTRLKTLAKVEWHEGQPYAVEFQDVYFSSDNGLLETEYVFIKGNDLPIRWKNLTSKIFTIAETGFGTGLNFLLAAKIWLETAPQDAILHFMSVEKHPISLNDISACTKLWPELQELSDSLLSKYENIINDEGTINLYNNRIQLSLLIGDATACLNKINLNARSIVIDAWFLDGFSPSRNPDMWQPILFEQMARLSNSKTTFATFTSAGAVRRGLLFAGFEVNKLPGFGKKREMLRGRFIGSKIDN